jgi:hypothetical protein
MEFGILVMFARGSNIFQPAEKGFTGTAKMDQSNILE